MKIIKFYDKERQPMLGSDSIMKIDGRFGARRIHEEIQKRNESFRKNFPHKVAYFFSFDNLRGKGYPDPQFKILQP